MKAAAASANRSYRLIMMLMSELTCLPLTQAAFWLTFDPAPPPPPIVLSRRPNMKAPRWRFGDPFQAPRRRRSSYALTEAAEALKSIQHFHVALAAVVGGTSGRCWRRRPEPLLPGLSWGGGGANA